MHNKLYSFILASVISISMLGCSNKETELPETEAPSEMEEMIVEEKQEYDFDEYNILTFGAIEVDNTSDYEGDTWIDFKCKVTNNSDKMVDTVTVDFTFYDEEGTLLSDTHPQSSDSIPGENSFYIDGLYDSTKFDVKGIKIISYSYYIDGVYYTVNLMGRTVEVWE